MGLVAELRRRNVFRKAVLYLVAAWLIMQIDEGWRQHAWYYLELDPNLDSIRGTAEFHELYEIVRADLAEQAERVQDLKASGKLTSVALRSQQPDSIVAQSSCTFGCGSEPWQ